MATFTGNAVANTLHGTAYADTIIGYGGNDRLYGYGGDDMLDGGDDDDRLDGGTGADEMRGGLGADTYFVDNTGDYIFDFGSDIDIVYSSISYTLPARVEYLFLSGAALTGAGNSDHNIVYGNGQGNLLWGYDGNDSLRGYGGNDSLYGGIGEDNLWGGDNNDRLFGNDNDDNLHGEAGIDRLYGGSGDDYLSGGADNDTLNGDAGADDLVGGPGADRCFGGGGDDEIWLDPADLVGSVTVYDGGSGLGDELVFSGQTLNLSALADNLIVGIEILDLASGNNSVTATLADVVALSDSDDLIVKGQSGDTFTSTGQGWVHAGTVPWNGTTYDHWVVGVVDLYVASDIVQFVS